jgi:hypothetical protein
MQSNDQRWLATCRSQGSKNKLRFGVSVPGNHKFARANTHGVESLRIVQTEEPVRNTAIGGKLRDDGGDVAAGALNSAGRKHVRE